MISAKEARSITDSSAARVALALKDVDKLIRQIAPNKGSAFLNVAGLHDMRLHGARAKPTQLQAAVMAELKTLGYEVAFCANPTSVPAPLPTRELDATCPLYIDCGILIKW